MAECVGFRGANLWFHGVQQRLHAARFGQLDVLHPLLVDQQLLKRPVLGLGGLEEGLCQQGFNGVHARQVYRAGGLHHAGLDLVVVEEQLPLQLVQAVVVGLLLRAALVASVEGEVIVQVEPAQHAVI